MGCCISRSSGPNSPYPGGAPNSSSRAINPPPLSLPESVLPSSGAGGGDSSSRSQQSSSSHNNHHHQNPHQQQRRRRRDQHPDQRINKPLRRHEWRSKDRTWTRRQLARERRDFFDTRVTGRAEIWQTLHAALQVIWDPTQDQDGQEGLGTAQTILSAAEILLPTGDLANGVYDSLGNYYALPEWIVCDPVNVVVDDEQDEEADDIRAEGLKRELSAGGDDTTAGGDDDDDDDISMATGEDKREKGKEIIDVAEQITLRARLSENGRDYKITAGKSEHVRSIAKKICEEAALPSTKKIRIAYMGKMLKENSSLESQGWQEGHILNALVFAQ